MVDFQENLVREHQQQINEALAPMAKRTEESASEQIATIHNTVDTMRQEVFAKLKEDFNAEKEIMLKEATAELEATFSNQMTKEQQTLQANIEAVLTKLLPELETNLHAQLQKELQQLLVKVKFVLP
jgi:cysteinyl-tRNA synthetase